MYLLRYSVGYAGVNTLPTIGIEHVEWFPSSVSLVAEPVNKNETVRAFASFLALSSSVEEPGQSPPNGRGRVGPHRRSGRVKVNVEPTPTVLATQIRPPWSSMNFRESASPSPVPSIFL